MKGLVVLTNIKRAIEPFYNKMAYNCISLFYYLPTKKRKIVFIKGNGEGFACNPRYVAEEIIRQKKPYDLVWLVNSLSEYVPQDVRKVKINHIKAVYELATAHVIITNSKSQIKLKKKASQIFVYIPHGQPGCKRAEGDAIISEEYIQISKAHSALTDVFVSMGTYHSQVLKDTFWVPDHAEIWETGFPRNDQYYRDTTEMQKELRSKLNIPIGYHIVHYAPTFRDNNTTEAYNLDLHRVLDTLERKTGDKWMMFITLHPNFIWFKKPIYDFGERIWNMSDYTDIHELLLIVDVVISDYSSVALDFANTRRPVFLYASDIEEYSKMRGLKDMYFHMPFTLCRTNDEINEAIMNFDAQVYEQRLDGFQKIYGSVDDGHASERFVERLQKIISQ
ncbi:MAG: CDP-glycerol glycerophosphotransferase family protein [Prevotella sp.]|nr:CDP-glycerol glycerophosphotransferase family protein [Prevotella sp.]